MIMFDKQVLIVICDKNTAKAQSQKQASAAIVGTWARAREIVQILSFVGFLGDGVCFSSSSVAFLLFASPETCVRKRLGGSLAPLRSGRPRSGAPTRCRGAAATR